MPKFKYPPLISLTALNDASVAISMMNNVLITSTSTHFTLKSLKTSFFGRLENYLMQITDYTLRMHYLYPKIDQVLREKGNLSGLPATESISRLSKLAMINHDPAIDTPEQFAPNVIGVGGLQIETVKPLTKVCKRKHLHGLVLNILGPVLKITNLFCIILIDVERG